MKTVSVPQGGGIDRLSHSDAADPGDPGPGELRVRVHASSLNNHDLSVVTGAADVAEGRIPLVDGAGVVEAVGAEVIGYQPGDNVVSVFFPHWVDGPARIDNFASTPGDGLDGFAAEIVVYPASYFTRAPSSLGHAETSTITTAGVTAWRSLVVNGSLHAGESVLVLGSGGVSMWGLVIAHAMGAQVIATSSSDEKRRRLESLGAEKTFSYRDNPEWGSEVFDWTDGRGVDHIIEVGGQGTLAQSIKAIRVGGTITTVGAVSGAGGAVPLMSVMLKQVRLQGMIVGSRANQLDLIRAIDTAKLTPEIDRRFNIDDLGEAFEYLASGKHFGKIVIDVQAPTV